jgi:hypothetical protein
MSEPNEKDLALMLRDLLDVMGGFEGIQAKAHELQMLLHQAMESAIEGREDKKRDRLIEERIETVCDELKQTVLLKKKRPDLGPRTN